MEKSPASILDVATAFSRTRFYSEPRLAICAPS